MEQAGKFDAAGEIGDFDASYARRAEPPDDSPSGIAIGDRRKVTAVKPDILQGAGIERVQFPQCCRVSPGLPQPTKAAFEHGSQRGQHRAGDSIEVKRNIGQSVGSVACRRTK
jgi:hypothetical protein